MQILYTILFYLALPFIFTRLLWRSRRIVGYRQHWGQRLGFFPHPLEKSIWVHAVSVGETIAAIPLIKALKKNYPHLPLLVTNMTPTGAARVKAAFGDTVLQAYIPYDLPDAVARFLTSVNPVVVVIMETELWPNLFAACFKRAIPLVIANARLSEKSARGYRKIPSLNRNMFAAITYLAVQAKADAERFIALGLPKEKVFITGNLKFDMELSADLATKSAVLHDQLGKERFIWIAASTHPGEEEIILSAHSQLRKKDSSALLILVPRHPDRFVTVAGLAEKQGFQVVKRSSGESCHPETHVYLGDSMGELMLMYSVADVAFVAGSFAGIGGHNMLEPAALHKPILTGPILFNFAEISQLLQDAKGMLVVQNAKELADTIYQLLKDAKFRHLMGENAYQVVAANRGALQRQVDLVTAAFS